MRRARARSRGRRAGLMRAPRLVASSRRAGGGRLRRSSGEPRLLRLLLPGVAQGPAQAQWLAALGAQRAALHRLHDELGRAPPLEGHVARTRIRVHPRAHHLSPLAEPVERSPDLALRSRWRQPSHQDRRCLRAMARPPEDVAVEAVHRVDEPLLLRHARQPVERLAEANTKTKGLFLREWQEAMCSSAARKRARDAINRGLTQVSVLIEDAVRIIWDLAFAPKNCSNGTALA